MAAGRGLGAYGLQASIAECHAVARSVAETDWQRIVILYEALGRLTPSPIVELNRAVAVAMASGPAAGLELVDAIASRGELNGSHLLPAVRGEMLTRLGRREEAESALQQAVGAVHECGRTRSAGTQDRRARPPIGPAPGGCLAAWDENAVWPRIDWLDSLPKILSMLMVSTCGCPHRGKYGSGHEVFGRPS